MLEALQDEGLVKAIGIYTSKLDMLKRLLDVCQVQPSPTGWSWCQKPAGAFGFASHASYGRLARPDAYPLVWPARQIFMCDALK